MHIYLSFAAYQYGKYTSQINNMERKEAGHSWETSKELYLEKP